ncbi:hypothetical protein RV134_180014 [Roseovarius sp. EC-HK134]|nr:hypothetical protein RV134_180014 [Roseovarius sp. EC-HK134]VVT00165.1 hypothetical protein RV420_230028 [Roseovarius sp. EC-SD190]
MAWRSAMGQKFGLWLEVGTISRLSYRIKTITNEGQQFILKGRNARLSIRTRMRSEITLSLRRAPCQIHKRR